MLLKNPESILPTSASTGGVVNVMKKLAIIGTFLLPGT